MHACGKGIATKTRRLHCDGGVFAFVHGDFRDIPVKLDNSFGAWCSTFVRPAGTNTYMNTPENVWLSPTFWGELLHYTPWLQFHNLLGIHDWFTLRHFVRKLTSSKMDKKRCKRGCIAKWFTTILLVNRTRNAAPSQCLHPPSQLSSQLTAIKCRNDLFKIGKSFTIWRLLLPLLS